MEIIHDFNDTVVQVCPKCDSLRGYFSFQYERQLTNEPMGLTVTCRCGYYWFERAADYQEPETDKADEG
ncbi:hypothetical protein LCGC14_2391170 [marine sediment metagenome]|uniref:TFIIS-type domain-containing protein n=1 Tax=marine sediment metagenome TaxID=412755 RepID=A0A0F9EAG3_9ZZZZ